MKEKDLLFTDNITYTLENWLKKTNKTPFVLVDSNTKKYCLPHLKIKCPVIEIKAGESSKNIENVLFIIEKLIDNKADKNAVLINLGGGVITDIGGFVATVFLRGIDFIHVPTTLLGMADASIGGKNGIDFKSLKNYIGTINFPQKIIYYLPFLETLKPKEIKNGYAEIIKIGIINDSKLISLLNKNQRLKYIKASAISKLKLVKEDVNDKGKRQLLNFGHSIGHAYESYCLSINKELSHGIAVVKGMLTEIEIAEKYFKLEKAEANRMREIIHQHFNETSLTKSQLKEIAPFLIKDKKNSKKLIAFSLPIKLGNGKIQCNITLDKLLNS